MAAPADAHAPFRPYREGCELDDRVIDIGGGTRIAHRIWRADGRLTDFAIQVQVDVGDADKDEWYDIIRVDCCHGEVHMHRVYSDDSVYAVLKSIQSQADVQLGFNDADEQVWDQYEEHVRRWRGGR